MFKHLRTKYMYLGRYAYQLMFIYGHESALFVVEVFQMAQKKQVTDGLVCFELKTSSYLSGFCQKSPWMSIQIRESFMYSELD